ncbi:MAG TPA: hypothetical protein V6C85_27130 [Allocoleopsis sp.]
MASNRQDFADFCLSRDRGTVPSLFPCEYFSTDWQANDYYFQQNRSIFAGNVENLAEFCRSCGLALQYI